MKKIILFFFLFYYNSLSAVEIKCNFEEVYQNGEVQEGLMMVKDDKLRYQYLKDSLYTIISKDNKFFLIKNDSKTVQKLSENTSLLESFINLASDYPDIENIYTYQDVIVKVEKSSDKFIKRLSIKSDAVNLSINIFNCKFGKIDKKYFKHFNFVEYDQ